MQPVTPFLWFDDRAEEAANHYVSIFNGRPGHSFTDATSFVIDCGPQEDVDHFWTRLAEGGEEGPCGWLKDRYGLSWQVVPAGMDELFTDSDPERARRAIQAMLKMRK